MKGSQPCWGLKISQSLGSRWGARDKDGVQQSRGRTAPIFPRSPKSLLETRRVGASRPSTAADTTTLPIIVQSANET